MLEDLNLTILLILIIFGFLAAFVDSVVGGGGLITLPALLFTGISPTAALATNKLTSSTGSVAIGQAKTEVVRTGEFAVQGMQEALLYVQTGEESHAELAKQLEDAINHLDREITSYLVEISTRRISESDSHKHALLLDSIRDIERIGDHCDNIVGLTKSLHNTNKNGITNEAIAEMEKMFSLTIETITKAIEALQTNNLDLARQVVEQEVAINQMEYRYRKTHIDRLREGSCTLEAGMVYVDILSNLERSGDHAVNLAEVVLGKRL